MLGNWETAWGDDSPELEPELTPTERARMNELEEENRRLRIENEFLKVPRPSSPGRSVAERCACRRRSNLRPLRRGGFNWSSQHTVIAEVLMGSGLEGRRTGLVSQAHPRRPHRVASSQRTPPGRPRPRRRHRPQRQAGRATGRSTSSHAVSGGRGMTGTDPRVLTSARRPTGGSLGRTRTN
jgi:hypothetical protein